MPLVNYFDLNLLTKIWQCGLILVPNAQKVVVVTISPDEHKKMNTEKGVNKPPAYLSNPKLWRQYHPTVIKNLHQLGAEAVGFDFWFPPAYDTAVQQTSLFVKVLAKKLRLTPAIEGDGVRLIGKPIPKRLWLAFSETPFATVPYHARRFCRYRRWWSQWRQ